MKQSHPGRPRAARKPGERSTLSLRITAELFERLDKAAKAKGRPLSQECEMMLEHAQRDVRGLDAMLALAYGPQLAVLVDEIAEVMRRAGAFAAFNVVRYTKRGTTDPLLRGDAWIRDAFCFDQAVQAAKTILEAWAQEITEGDRTPKWARDLRERNQFPSEDLPDQVGETAARHFLSNRSFKKPTVGDEK
jgi:hypothetical protein